MAAEKRTAEEFAFGFDEPFEPLVFSRTRPVSGWLVDTSGEPIHGIRVIVTKRLRPRHVVRARRKRSRPDIGAAFPAIPAAESSGFYVNVPLRAGGNRLLFQVPRCAKMLAHFFQCRDQSGAARLSSEAWFDQSPRTPAHPASASATSLSRFFQSPHPPSAGARRKRACSPSARHSVCHRQIESFYSRRWVN